MTYEAYIYTVLDIYNSVRRLNISFLNIEIDVGLMEVIKQSFGNVTVSP